LDLERSAVTATVLVHAVAEMGEGREFLTISR
jgi:hypothetical protein